jgi:hypothetical protein
MKAFAILLMAGLFLTAFPASAQEGGRQEQVRLDAATGRATIQGTIKGYAFVDHLPRAETGQILSVDFAARNGSANFNVQKTGADAALFVGSLSGRRFEAALPGAGVYAIRVYLMRNAARRGESTAYTLKLALAAAGPQTPTNFDQTLALQGIRFRVTSHGEGAARKLRIEPQGLEIDNTPIERPIPGPVARAEIGDANGDGSPEIYVAIASPGRGTSGHLVAYSANRRKSLSEIYLPPFGRGAPGAKGYQGQDEFALGENAILRRFPVYAGAARNARATGKTRQVQYRLVAGEAGWRLRAYRVTEY